MAEHLKSASVMQAALLAKIEMLERELETAWSTPIVTAFMIVIFLAGFLVGTIL